MTRVLALTAMCWLLLPAGCGGPCTPGKSISCTCTSGAQGAQVCRDDETYSACDCSDTAGMQTVAPWSKGTTQT